jgi:hypothetical protein
MQRLQGFANRVVLSGLVLMTLFVLLSSLASGQENQGSIAGNVVDSSGALVAGAKLTAKGQSTGTVYSAVSSSAGSYRFPNVNIGTYDITINAPGFKTTTLTGILVQVATTAAIDIKLAAGGINESIVVSADAPTVQSESSDIGTVVGEKQILDLPLALGSTVEAMRSPEAFVYLTPGAVGPGSDSGNGGTFESKISGGQNYGTEVLLDGASMTRSENGSSFDETAPSVDALSEFKVLTSTIPAEFGQTTGGVESFNTKGGTNKYHGELYDIFRNEDLDANTWGDDFALSQGLPYSTYRTPLDKQNDYGGTFGGPVRIPHLYDGRDKTFFFFSWEQYRQTVGGTTTTTVPTAAELTGDFTATLDTANILGTNPCDGTNIYQGEIFDPATTQTVGGVECRTAFMNEAGNIGNNKIPSGRFSAVGQNLLSYYPAAQTSGLANNYTFGYSYPILDTTMTFRIDQNISSKSKAYFTYSSRNNVRLSTTPEWGNAAGEGRNQFFGTHYLRFSYDYSFTPSLLNHLNLGYNRTNSKNVGAGVAFGHGDTDWDAKLGITGADGVMFPGISPGEASTAGFGDNVDGDTIDNGFRVADTLTWIKGKHEFKVGFEGWYQQFSPLNFQNTSGSFNFGRGQTAGTAVTDNLSGNGIASMLLGELNSANVTSYASQARWLSTYYAGFFQDTFKLMPTLTLMLGFRYDVDEPRKEAYGDTSNISLTEPNPGAGNLPGVLVFAGNGAGRNGNVNERWANIWKKDFGPRVGFAWSPSVFNGKTVFRGGYGIIYGNLQYADFGGFGLTGFQANPGFNSVNGFDPAFVIDSGLPSYPAPPNLDPTQANFTGPDYIDPKYGRPPMQQNWSFEVQHELAPDLIMDVAYVGTHSQNLRSNYDAVNTLNPEFFSLGAALNTPISASALAPPFAGFPANSIVAQALLPFPQYYGFNTDGQLENLGQSTYNALEAQLTRRFRNGLNLMASYTWSKTLTNADSALPYFATLHQGGAPQDVFNPRGDKAISNQDLPQNFVLSYIYELPFGKNKKFLNSNSVLDRVVGGWSLSGIQRYESGQPLAFGCATGVPAYNDCIREDYIPGASIFSPAWKSKSGNFVPITAATYAAGDPGIPMFNPLDTAPGAVTPAFDDPNSPQNLGARGTYAFGTSPRVDGSVRMGAYLSEDFNLMKRTKITEGSDLLLQVNFLNAFNRHVWNRPGDLGLLDSGANTGIGQTNGLGGNFGVIDWNDFSTTGGGGYLLFPRRIQLQLKYEF